MRLPPILFVLAVLLLGGEAKAQYANRSLGIAAGYMKLDLPSLDWGVPVGLEGSVYVENGFDVIFHGYGLLLNDNVYQKQFVGVFAAGGVRYLFSQETVRPYVGLELGYFQTFGQPVVMNGQSTNLSMVGLSPVLGLDFFVTDTTSIGLRGQYTAYWYLNMTQYAQSIGAHFLVSTWF